MNDCIDQLDASLTPMRKVRRGTLTLPDGEHGISRTLHLPQGVSLVLEGSATLRALPGFKGDAVVEVEPYAMPKENPRWAPQRICGGIIDGGSQQVVGIRTIRDRETDIHDLTVRNCLSKGIHVGTEGDCEVNLRGIRVQCERGIHAARDSIGVHYDKCTDSLVSQLTVIGYAVGFRSDSSSNDISQAHVWNYDANVKLRTCFECFGWNDSYSQCYADSPMNGEEIGIGFLVGRPFQRFSNCRVYLNQWVTPDKVVGFQIEPHGSHGCYMGNHFAAGPKQPFRRAYAGTLQAATILGCTYTQGATRGAVSQLPSGGGGTTQMPPLQIGPGRAQQPARTD